MSTVDPVLENNDWDTIQKVIQANKIEEAGWHVGNKNGENKDMTNGAEMVVARYVRVFWELVTTTMIDEIEVFISNYMDGELTGYTLSNED